MIIIVSGVPRSGTSMTMRILDMGGISAFHDIEMHKGLNKYGCFERRNHDDDLNVYEGRCVKSLMPNALFATPKASYKVIMPVRDPEQVILSRMRNDMTLELFAKRVRQVSRMMDFLRFVIKSRDDMPLLEIPYEDYFTKTEEVVQRIADFVGVPFDKEKAILAVDKELYKVRTKDGLR